MFRKLEKYGEMLFNCDLFTECAGSLGLKDEVN